MNQTQLKKYLINFGRYGDPINIVFTNNLNPSWYKRKMKFQNKSLYHSLISTVIFLKAHISTVVCSSQSKSPDSSRPLVERLLLIQSKCGSTV